MAGKESTMCTIPQLMTPVRIPVRAAGLRDRRFHFLPPAAVLYFFAGGAAHEGVTVPGYAPEVFRRGRVYARTRSGVYATCYSTLRVLTEHLDPSRFRRVHRGIVANLRRIEMFDPRVGGRRVGLHTSRVPVEWIPVADSCARSLGKALGLPGRRPPARDAPAPFRFAFAGAGPH